MTGKATSSQNNASEAGSLSLDQSVAVLPGIGEKRAELLRNLEVVTVRDLLFHFPRNYEDRRRPCPIARLKEGDTAAQQQFITDFKAAASTSPLLNAEPSADVQAEVKKIPACQDVFGS